MFWTLASYSLLAVSLLWPPYMNLLRPNTIWLLTKGKPYPCLVTSKLPSSNPWESDKTVWNSFIPGCQSVPLPPWAWEAWMVELIRQCRDWLWGPQLLLSISLFRTPSFNQHITFITWIFQYLRLIQLLSKHNSQFCIFIIPPYLHNCYINRVIGN